MNDTKKAILIITVSLLLTLSPSILAVDYDSGDGVTVQWEIVTKQNFSSQISLHPHLLLLITLPWSGEARSLMKELVLTVNKKHEKFGPLKLRVMYKNHERMLSDALGAKEGLTFIYYHHSLPYIYQGRYRAHNILSSIYFQMSLSPEELPFRPLNTPEAVNAFLESTDKAVILLEFCGWTPRLLVKEKNNVTEDASGIQGALFGADSDGDISRQLLSSEKKDQGQNKKINCAEENKDSGIHILGELLSVNATTPFLNTENTRPGVGLSCTFEEFQLFYSFFTNLTAFSREFFLPPERIQYGFISEKALLSFLGVKDSGPWFAMLNFAGGPSCSQVFKEVDDLRFVLQKHKTFVSELEEDGQDNEPTLSVNMPTVLLFVDRSSESSAIRKKSREALDAFRHTASNYKVSHLVSSINNDQPRKFSAQAPPMSTSRHPISELSTASKKILGKDKMSFMIVKEGKNINLDSIASNSQGKSLNEILAYIRQQKKETTLSSLAKELGFQLLSDDLDIKIEDTVPSNAFQSTQLSSELPLDGIAISDDELAKDESHIQSISNTIDIKPTSQYTEKTAYMGIDAKLISVESDINPASTELDTAEDEMNDKKVILKVEKQLHVEGFKGSFVFSDGGNQLLRALTAGSKIPSLVIIDPISMQHFVYPEHGVFSNFSMSAFLEEFSNGSLISYQRNESVHVTPKEAMRPPLVNRDFHEVDSIPPVTASSLSNMILGLNQSSIQNSCHACKEDVLVIFSNRWCGFCQRMELVVREVYRALKGYKILKDEKKDVKMEFGSGNLKDAMLKLPLVYLMDCTLNECGSVLNSLGQREVYPALMLFPAERKHVIYYQGDMVVTDVIKFIANHGSHSHHLIAEKGITLADAENGGKNQNSFKNASSDDLHEQTLSTTDNFNEILLRNRVQKRTVKYNQIKPSTSHIMGETTLHIVAGSILIATEKLDNIPSFDKSKILIVHANQSLGFEGLVINKLISWDSFNNLAEGLEMIKQAPLSFGGPVVKNGLPLVALSRKIIKNGYPEVVPGFYFLDQYATAREIESLRSGNQSVSDYWFFLGYSSWGWEQLFDEIADGSWNLNDNSMVQLEWPH